MFIIFWNLIVKNKRRRKVIRWKRQLLYMLSTPISLLQLHFNYSCRRQSSASCFPSYVFLFFQIKLPLANDSNFSFVISFYYYCLCIIHDWSAALHCKMDGFTWVDMRLVLRGAECVIIETVLFTWFIIYGVTFRIQKRKWLYKENIKKDNYNKGLIYIQAFLLEETIAEYWKLNWIVRQP